MSSEDNFKAGTVVQLKSGGPNMTVMASDSDGRIVCQWFGNGAVSTYGFFPFMLREVPEDNVISGGDGVVNLDDFK